MKIITKATLASSKYIVPQQERAEYKEANTLTYETVSTASFLFNPINKKTTFRQQ